MSKGGGVYRACESYTSGYTGYFVDKRRGFEINFHRRNSRRAVASRATLLRAFVSDIEEKLGLRDARERKSVSRREQSAAMTAAVAVSVLEENRARLLAERRGSFYINFGNLSQETS